MVTVNDIGKRIKELRIAKGLSQQALADKLSVKQNTISRYENNSKRPSLEVLIIIADIFGTTTDYILGREEV